MLIYKITKLKYPVKKHLSFSLVEIMVVIAIIGILSAIEVVSLFAGCKGVIGEQLATMGSFPPSLDCLGGLSAGTLITTAGINFYYQIGTTTSGQPKLYISGDTPEIPTPTGNGNGLMYFGAFVEDEVIKFACGTWDDRDVDIDPKYLPASCQEKVLSAVWSQ